MSMSIREIKQDDTRRGRNFAIWDTCSCRFMDYDGLGFSEEHIDNHIGMGNPFPDDKFYSYTDMIYDFTEASGSITMRCEKEETADWIAEMINDLI